MKKLLQNSSKHIFKSMLLFGLLFLSIQTNAQYCTNNLHANTCSSGSGGDISNFSIVSGNLDNSSSVCPGNGVPYESFSPAGTNTDTLQPNSTYTFSVTCLGNDIISIWIDYDQSGTFDSSEWTQVTTSSTANVATTVSITIPNNASNGSTGLRVRSRLSGNPNGYNDACLQFGSGATQDYSIYIGTATPCSGQPTAGNTLANYSSVCTTNDLILKISGTNAYSGITRQWQTSPDDITWTDVVGETNPTYKLQQTSATYYRCYLVCTNTNDADTSVSVFVDQNAATSCYCIPSYTTGTSAGDYISYCEINTLKNTTTGASAPYYTYYQGNPTTKLKPGSKYIVKVAPGTFSGQGNNIALFIDANGDGDFDDFGEKLGQKNNLTASTKDTFTVTIPNSISVSKTRIRFKELYNNANMTACVGGTYGETEDYDVDIDQFTEDLSVKSITPYNLCTTNNQDITVTISNVGTNDYDFTKTTLTVSADVTGYSAGSYSTTVTSGKLTVGSTLDVVVTNAANLGAGQTSNIKAYISVANDKNTANDTLKISTALGTTPINYSEFFDNSMSVPSNISASNFAVVASRGNLDLFGSPTNGLSYYLNNTAYASATFPSVGPVTSNSIVQFDYHLVTANNTGATLSKKDSINLFISTDCGSSWTLFETINGNNFTASTNWNTFTGSLASYIGQPVIAKITASSSSNSFYADIDNIKIGDNPYLDLGADISTCATSVDLDAGANAAFYYWSTGETTQTINVTQSGMYYAAYFDSKGFYTIDSIQVDFYTAPVVSLGNNQSICAGAAVTLDAGSFPANYTYLWNTGATTQTISVTTSGTYSVQVITPGGCYGDASVVISINNPPSGISVIKGATFDGQFNNGTSNNPDGVCEGNTISYELTPPTGFTNSQFGTGWTISSSSAQTSGGATPSGTINQNLPSTGNFYVDFTPNNADAGQTYIFSATIQDLSTGCETTVERYVTVNPLPVANLGNDQTVCIGNSVNLDAGSFSSYLWSDGSTNQTLSTTAAGTYWVKVTNANGCEDYDTVSVFNYPAVSVSLGNDQGICPGTTIQLDAGNGFTSFIWNTGATTQKLDVTTAGTYYVKATNANGCVAYDTVTFNQLPKPTAAFNYAFSGGRTYTFDASPSSSGVTYSWAFGDGGTSTIVNPSHTYSSYNPVRVILTVTNADGCTDTISHGFKVGTNGNSGIVSIDADVFGLTAYPNPFSGNTTLAYSLEKNAPVVITLYDLTGREVATLFNGNNAAGDHQLNIDTQKYNTSQGIYMVRLVVNGQSQTLRLVDLGK